MPVPWERDAMSVDGSDIPILTAAQEKEAVKELRVAEALHEGDTFYLISYRWWRLWQDYTEKPNVSSSESGEPLTALTSVPFGGLPKRPFSIDNADLVVTSAGDQKTEHELRDGLVENRDYVLLAEQLWLALHKWYGGGPVLPRRVITNGYGSREGFAVEVYPLQLHFSVQPSGKKATLRFSRKDSISKLHETVCELFKLEPGNIRVYDYFNKQKNKQLSDSMMTLEDADIHMKQDILVEVQVNGKWPDEISNGSSFSGREMSVISESRSIANGPPASKVGTRNGTVMQYPLYSMESSGKDSDIWLGSTSSNARVGPKGLTGLQNLGNTCFMNSSLQCLAHMPPLVKYFLQDYSKEINRQNPLGMGGELASAFGDLLRNLWTPGKQPVAPRAFKTKLARFAPQFSGYNQHDSQELLAFLLDGLHEDLNRVKTKPYIEPRDADGRPDNEVALEYWANHRARNDSVIVDVCQGQYKSTLVCPVCSKVSVTFDPFMYLSLPLPAKTTRTMTVTVISGDGSSPPTPYTVTLSRHGKYKDLIQAVGSACSLGSDERLLLAEFRNHRIYRFLDDSLEWINGIRDDDYVAAYRLPKSSEKGPLIFLMHRHLEVDSNSLKNTPEWNLFGVPLITCLPEETPTGAQLVNTVLKLLRPMARNRQLVTTDSLSLEVERTDIDVPQLDTEMLEQELDTVQAMISQTGSSDDSYSEKEQLLPFELWTCDDKGSTRECMIEMDKPIPQSNSSARSNTKVRYVSVDWSAHALEHEYDMGESDMPPEVLRTGLPLPSSKKSRQEAVSLYTCLESFLKEEPLGPEDMWYCPRCKEHRQASKKLDLWVLPEILVVHLKRFSYSRFLKNKLETFVNFPVHDLDLNKYVAGPNEEKNQTYELYAVSNHYGSMGGGHYSASAKLLDDKKWFLFDDSHVSPISESDIKTSAVYVLFYRRIQTEEYSMSPNEYEQSSKANGSNQRELPLSLEAETGHAHSYLPP